MISDFGTTFDSYRSAYDDLRLYHEAKGYMSEGDRTYWEPMYEVDVEPVTPAYGPGAMRVGELNYSEFYEDTDEPNFGYDEFEEF